MRCLRPLVRLVVTCAVLLALGPTHSETLAVAAPARKVPVAASLQVEKYSLKNGLEVILHRDGSLPLVAVNLWYHVGPANEPAGRSGFAHLFEHLMFEGSRHVGRQYDSLLEAVGATNVNGTTSWDRTNYFATVPREHLALVLWLESDRMGFMLDGLDQSRLSTQRRVVENERRQSYENAPYGPSSLVLLNTLFPAGHPYHGAIIGSRRDLGAATLEDVRSFFDAYYAPSNATLAVAGDFDPVEVRKLILRYFGTLRTKPPPPRRTVAASTLVHSERHEVVEPVALGKVSLGFVTPPAFSDADLALDLATLILAPGRTSRLYRALVVEQQVASEVGAYVDGNQICGMSIIHALAASGRPLDALETALDMELRRLAREGPSPRELARAQRQRLVDVLSEIQQLDGDDGESGRAGLLQRFNHYLGDPAYLPTYLRRLQRMTVADVRQAADEYLVKRPRVVVVTRPAQGGVR